VLVGLNKNGGRSDDGMKFTAEVTDVLKSYVYVYTDPRDNLPFYVGKGVGNRAFAHLSDTSETEKAERIRQIRRAGQEPEIDVLRYGMSEAEASLVEACAIDFMGLASLTNRVRGQHSSSFGRMSYEDLVALVSAKPVKITETAILITINRCYRSDMSAQELYEATRGTWKVGAAREQAELAMAVFQGVVREVYRIKRWVPAGTLPYETRDSSALGRSGRWEFEGEAASDLRERYVGYSVREYLSKGGRNPIRYVLV
jgi:hypothetical protein